jgi:TadE-like protein
MPIDRRRRRAGQTLAEVAIVLPLLFLIIFGLVELGWAIYQSNVMRGYVREASNIISRNGTIEDAEVGVIAAAAAGGPVDVGSDTDSSKLILSVVTLASTGDNRGQPVIIQRHAVGRLEERSVLGDPPASAFGNAPNYDALDPSDDSRLVATLPDGYTLQAGQSLFVTEIYTRRERIVDVGELPDVLYASAFF